MKSEIEHLRDALNEKVQHHLDAHPDCDGYVQSSERKNALYDRDRRLNEIPASGSLTAVPERRDREKCGTRW